MNQTETKERADAISMTEAWVLVWRSRWLVLAGAAFAAVLALAYVFTAKDWYRAEVLVKVTDTKSDQSMGGALGGLGGLAGLAGLAMPNDSSAEPIAILTSREFVGKFVEDQNLLHVFFASKWDASRNQWKSSRPEAQPDLRDAVKYFNKKVLSVQEDKKTGFIRIDVDWTDPKIAADWANLLVARINENMRSRALAESETNVAYLKQELETANVVTVQQSVGRVLENQLQKLMLARANKEYAFTILDHAQPPKWRSSPQRALILGTAVFFGIALSAVFLLVREQVRRFRASARGGAPSHPA